MYIYIYIYNIKLCFGASGATDGRALLYIDRLGHAFCFIAGFNILSTTHLRTSSVHERMPKANKHAEVKPSKYKTSLCQFFSKGEECPYAHRCAFAHGEHELQTELKNMELLKATGLLRLDGVHAQEEVTVSESHTPSSNSVTSSATTESLAPSEAEIPTSPAVRTRRRTVMVSLPKQNTRCEVYQSPYSATQYEPRFREYGGAEYGYPTQLAQEPVHHMRSDESPQISLYTASNAHDNQYCDCRFSATCSQGQPSVYRHNPYDMAGRIAQCA
ncbi:hypothetical protein, conserved [Leishmania tarentolae]|uniref:C3H1-type domain-containing protein n=1 Tax=Leishmania tarentolae TaxID=5689 RepID=A0A640KDH4_LEITA|nr:hypothetical protein, conserved [Leishmania tarentolae]